MADRDSGRCLSEDWAFRRRWRDMGGKVWIDLQCKLAHLGQHNFRGDLAESLRRQGLWRASDRDLLLIAELHPAPRGVDCRNSVA
jgi:hypothetical protein